MRQKAYWVVSVGMYKREKSCTQPGEVYGVPETVRS